MKNKDFIHMAMTNVFNNVKSEKIFKSNLDAYFKLFDEDGIILLENYFQKNIKSKTNPQFNKIFSGKIKNKLFGFWKNKPLKTEDLELIEKYFSYLSQPQQIQLNQKIKKDLNQAIDIKTKEEPTINQHIRSYLMGDIEPLKNYVQDTKLKAVEKAKIYKAFEKEFKGDDCIDILTLINEKQTHWDRMNIGNFGNKFIRQILTVSTDTFKKFYDSFEAPINQVISEETDKKEIKMLLEMKQYRTRNLFSNFLFEVSSKKFLESDIEQVLFQPLSSKSGYGFNTLQKENFINNVDYILSKEKNLSLQVEKKIKMEKPINFSSLNEHFKKIALRGEGDEPEELIDTVKEVETIIFHQNLDNCVSEKHKSLPQKTIKI